VIVGGVTVIVGGVTVIVGGVTVIVGGVGQGGVEEGVVEGVSVGVYVPVGVSTGVLVLVAVITGGGVRTGVMMVGCGVGCSWGGVATGGLSIGSDGDGAGTITPSPGATGRVASGMISSLPTGVRVSFTGSVAVAVGVSVAPQPAGRDGGLMMPVVINTVLKRIAIMSTATNGSAQPTMRENPGKGANPFFAGCCCAAAVRKAERPGRNP
jgi:hypothetical protein